MNGDAGKCLFMLPNWHRIGHMFMEPCVYLNITEYDKKNVVFLVPNVSPANAYAAHIVGRYADVRTSPEFQKLYTLSLESDQVYCDNYRLVSWHNGFLEDFHKKATARPDSLEYFFLDKKDVKLGLLLDKSLGIDHDARVVALHSREPGYLPSLTYHGYRDSNITNFNKSIDYLIDQGYVVVRIGDPSMTPLAPRKNLFDLAITADKHPFADIWFILRARFMIGTTSGPIMIPIYFNMPPLLVVNKIPRLPMLLPAGSRFMPKKLYSNKRGRLMTLKEIKCAGFEFDMLEDYNRRDLVVMENTEDEILDAVIEMDNNIRSGLNDLFDHELQKKYDKTMSYIAKYVKKNTGENYMYINTNRLATSFLKRHPWFVD